MVEVQKMLSDAIQAGITGQQQPQDALDQAQKSAEQVLNQFQT
jgi:ABC-type glycerol-3-phosphate transport system substrate-binding protein